MSVTYEDALVDLAAQRPELIVLTAENRAAIRGLPARLPGAFVDVGICEQTMIGMAAGLALRGRLPVVHALATFLTLRAFEFIRTDVGIPGLPVILVGGVPGFLSEANGPTHQAIEDVALMRGIPGMQVVCPVDTAELCDALPAIAASRRPTYVRYPAAPAGHTNPAPFALGQAEVTGDGFDVAILTYGLLVPEAQAARALLEARGVATRVVNLRTLKPVDERALLIAARARLVVVVEDHFAVGGLSSILAEVLLQHERRARVRSLALPERWFRPALLPAVLEHEGFTGRHIAERALSWLAGPSSEA
jgi:transketolase